MTITDLSIKSVAISFERLPSVVLKSLFNDVNADEEEIEECPVDFQNWE